ncbi:hypothetical protein G7Y79_00012g033070 [Physcia stellaris]|nr:hypothetical protein G7Y79_00012g033070 [Physcia stellaris]
MAELDDAAGYQLEFDSKRKCYATRNRKYLIRPRLDRRLRKEHLSGSELATTSFVLKTDHPAMVFLEELRVLGRPFDPTTLEELKQFCARPVDASDELHVRRKVFLNALKARLVREQKIQRNLKRSQGRFQKAEDTISTSADNEKQSPTHTDG